MKDKPAGYSPITGEPFYDFTSMIAARDTLLHDAAEMLRTLEWVWADDGGSECPNCNYRKSKGHKPDCELAALLKRLEGV